MGCRFNHALVQLYRSGTDHITEHADKTLDIVQGTPIVSVSLGCSRLFTLRSKSKMKAGTGPERVCKLALPSNSAMVLGWDTNQQYTHQISQDRRADGQRRQDETICEGQRISITMRVVGTFKRVADGRMFGQGARFKTEEALDTAINAGDVDAGLILDCKEDATRMMSAFHQENKDPNFDWMLHYSEGFDVVNFATLNSDGA